jgi:hypothetical protein
VVSVSTIGFETVLTVWTLFLPLGVILFLRCGLCFYDWVCNFSSGVVSVSTIGFVPVLTCGLCFYHCVCNCSYGVVSVSTIGFVTVLTVWSLFLPLGL